MIAAFILTCLAGFGAGVLIYHGLPRWVAHRAYVSGIFSIVVVWLIIQLAVHGV